MTFLKSLKGLKSMTRLKAWVCRGTGAALMVSLLALPSMAENIAIVGGKAFTNGGAGQVENATILVSDGKIVSVTSGGPVPSGFRVIDASGKWVTAGFMAVDTTLGLSEVALSGGIVDARTSVKDGIGLNAAYALDPASTHIGNARVNGITRAMTRTTRTEQMWTGQGAVIKLSGEAILVREKAFLGLDLSEGSASRNGGSRAAIWTDLRAKLSEAVDKASASKDAEDGEDKKAKKPSAADAALAAVVAGDLPLYVTINRKADIERLIDLKAEFGLKVIIGGGAAAWMVADQLAAANIAVVLDPTRNLPEDFETLAQTGAAAGRLHAAGVKVAFTPPRGNNNDLVIQGAGNAVAMGMPWEAAVDALTVNPAAIFGIGDSYGALTPGKDGDIVVWDGDPLELMTNAETVLIAGVEIPMVSRQTKLRDRYKDLTRSPAFRR